MDAANVGRAMVQDLHSVQPPKEHPLIPLNLVGSDLESWTLG